MESEDFTGLPYTTLKKLFNHRTHKKNNIFNHQKDKSNKRFGVFSVSHGLKNNVNG